MLRVPLSGLIYTKRRGEFAVRVGLIDELLTLLLKRFDGIGTCGPAQRWIIPFNKLH
jgi:hypothetical protein